MKCPSCDCENNDSAKFCKKCGNPLQKTINHGDMIKSINGSESKDNTTTLIIVALVIVAIALAGAFAYISLSNNSDGADSIQESQSSQESVDTSSDTADHVSSDASSSAKAQQSSSTMKILGGSFTTGSELADKTYASIYVGKEHAGESCTVQIFYSRNGNSLNNGNMVPASVHSDGYLEISSADSYRYYPDYATINLYDNSGNLMDTKSVSLMTTSGTQTF